MFAATPLEAEMAEWKKRIAVMESSNDFKEVITEQLSLYDHSIVTVYSYRLHVQSIESFRQKLKQYLFKCHERI